MSRIEPTFERLRAGRRKALIPYLTAGDPDPEATVAIMLAMAEAGADVIELGVPFSDPMADGPVIQQASERALAKGVGLRRVLGFVRDFRASNARTPIVLMGYANPIEAMGVEKFIGAARTAGVDGVIVVDLPAEEADPFAREAEAAGLDLVYMVAPTSTPERVRLIARRSRGFIYMVSLRGVTGERKELPPDLAAQIGALRRVTKTPVCVGFGVSTPEQVAAVGRVADGAAVGSAIVRLVEERAGSPSLVNDVGAFIAELKAPLRAGLDLAGRKGA